MLTLYNTLTRKKEAFKPIHRGKTGMYCCGPTVYNYAHIGNLRSYIFEDVLRRVLEYNTFDVKHVMNITDVGHLTSDADTGEDKMEKSARAERMSAWDISKKYAALFFEDEASLNIQKPHIICKATDHIPEQIALIKKLEEKGYTYGASDGIYFDTSKFSGYGDFAKLNIEGLQAGQRIEMGEKKNKTDFALWKFSKPEEKRDMEWDSPWGRGFPGWHIECSAMSMKYLGEQFDIHCGGIDHIPIHHTNEIAQSEAATGKHPWVKYWLHNEFIIMSRGKMSKSSGEFITLQVLIDKGYEPVVYRYFCLGAHYRQQLTFSFEGLDAAKNAYDKLKVRIIEMKQKGEKGPVDDVSYLSKFTEAINDDLNTPKALAVMWDMLKDDDVANKLSLLLEFDRVLGLGIKDMKKDKFEVPEEINMLLAHRKDARKKRDWKLCDELRDKIKSKGFLVLDTPEGQKVEKA